MNVNVVPISRVSHARAWVSRWVNPTQSRKQWCLVWIVYASPIARHCERNRFHGPSYLVGPEPLDNGSRRSPRGRLATLLCVNPTACALQLSVHPPFPAWILLSASGSQICFDSCAQEFPGFAYFGTEFGKQVTFVTIPSAADSFRPCLHSVYSK